MASGLDTIQGRVSVSPSSSGRNSPVPTKWSQFRNDEFPSKDKNYRRYAAGVERSLSLFDTTLQEWADYISFLSRLLKSLQARPATISSVPSKAIVAKRLAQCLNPSLPSGVHQKALEVYAFIFAMVGTEGLSRDLPLYLPGLAPTLSFASLSVRAPFLDLLEQHFLQLDNCILRPALKTFILALLPGLEEENGEEFERILQLLDAFKRAVRPKNSEVLDIRHATGDEYFWQCFFLAVITSNGRRLGALAYLERNLPRLFESHLSDSRPDESGDQLSILYSPRLAKIVTSPEPGLLVRCFASGLGDEHVLIQRGFQDLLLSHLPLHADVLQKEIKTEDLEILMMAAAGVVSRREMSLNRRLWTWLLGPESAVNDNDNGPHTPVSLLSPLPGGLDARQSSYFERFGMKPLTNALLKLIAYDTMNPVERVRPFKICLSLMDKWEIGAAVVPCVFLPIVKSVRSYKKRDVNKSDFSEVLKSASVFFDGVESGLIWGEIVGLILQAIETEHLNSMERCELLSIVRFMLTHFNVREEEMLLVHAPLTVLTLLTVIELVTDQKEALPADVLILALGIATELSELIPKRAFDIQPAERAAGADSARPKGASEATTDGNIMEDIKEFYFQNQGTLEAGPPPFSSTQIGELLLRQASRLVMRGFNSPASDTSLEIRSRFLVLLLAKVPSSNGFDMFGVVSSLKKRVNSPGKLSFQVFSCALSLVTLFAAESQLSVSELSTLVDILVRQAWKFLEPTALKYHVETARNLWHLQVALSFSNREIEASICSIMADTNSGLALDDRTTDGQKFTVLWTHVPQDPLSLDDRRPARTSLVSEAEHHHVPDFDPYEVLLGKPLFLMLDALVDEHCELFMTTRIWLQNLVGADKLLRVFVSKFSSLTFFRTQVPKGDPLRSTTDILLYNGDDDIEQCLYYLRTFSNVLKWSSEGLWKALTTTIVQPNRISTSSITPATNNTKITIMQLFLDVCLKAVSSTSQEYKNSSPNTISQLHRSSLSIMHQLLSSTHALNIGELDIEERLIERLHQSLYEPDPFVQVSLLEVIYDILKLKSISRDDLQRHLQSPTSDSRQTVVHEGSGQQRSPQQEYKHPALQSSSIFPHSLIQCLQAALVAEKSRTVLDSWIHFLVECIPLYADLIFQVLMPLVEIFCAQIQQLFDHLRGTFEIAATDIAVSDVYESTLLTLLHGLEHVLAQAHHQLLQDEIKSPVPKITEQPQGFFGNMVSGVFSSDLPAGRSAVANNRLTVLLSFRDAVRICHDIWSWGVRGSTNIDPASAGSFSYTSIRMRNRARRLLEHLFAAEALECLETIVEVSQKNDAKFQGAPHIYDLLHVLDGSRPKYTIPAIFNAIYSRTNPSALEQSRKSSLTSPLSDLDLVLFLVDYAKSLEDDAMDEIWTDCMTFLRDLLTNPFPHRQTLPSLLEFAAILGEKVDNTNFGEQRRKRRELGDLFLRLLTAICTTRPMGFYESAGSVGPPKSLPRHDDVLRILSSIVPNLPKILVEQDKVMVAANTVVSGIVNPTFKSKSFPENITKTTLVLLHQLFQLSNVQKPLRKEIGDAFNDPRFFSCETILVRDEWLPLLRQWCTGDKERLPELFTRLISPATAGIVFGVGATSARLEADRKTQLNLRRIATLILAATDNNFIAEMPNLLEKVVELLSATTTSSPSSNTRADIYLLIRAIVLKTAPVHLSGLWPIVIAELQAAISSIVAPDHSLLAETYNNYALLQACKLLDCLICVAPDDFQLHRWLFITDTIDAVYRPSGAKPQSLVDEISEELGRVSTLASSHIENTLTEHTFNKQRRPLIGFGNIDDRGSWDRKEDLVGRVLRPFFGQLSIFAFESTYSMGQPDIEVCRNDLLADVFDEKAIARLV